MDFFDEMSAAISRDSAKRGVRVAPDEWQRFAATLANKSRGVPQYDRKAGQCFEPAAAIAPAEDSVRQMEEFTVPAAAVPGVAPAAVADNWEGLQQQVLQCQSCTLCRSRQNAVFGEGARNARLMFIGEGPGAEEDASGRPFVGAAGQLLDKMINAMHLAREEVYIANIVKCRPPGNRMPAEDEAVACIGYLERQIELIRPEVIVLLGGTALHFLLKIDGITRCRGRWFEYKNIAVMPTFHPAFLLRKAESKREAWHDLKLVMTKLGIAV